MNKPESQLSQEVLGVDILSDEFLSRRNIEQKSNEIIQNLFYGRVQDLLLGLAEVRRRQRGAGQLVDKTQLSIKLGRFFKGLVSQDEKFANEVMRLFQALDFNQKTQDEMFGNEAANLYSMYVEGKFRLKTDDELNSKLKLPTHNKILIFPASSTPNYKYRHRSVGKFGLDNVNLISNKVNNDLDYEHDGQDYVLYVHEGQNAKDLQYTLNYKSIENISDMIFKMNKLKNFTDLGATFRGLTVDEYCYLQAHHRINIHKPNDDTDYLDNDGVSLLLGSVTDKGKYWTGKTMSGGRIAFMPYNDFMANETAPRFALEVNND